MADLCETDPYAWSLDQAEALRAMARGEWRAGLDLPHLIEEFDAWPEPPGARKPCRGCLVVKVH